MVTGAKTPCVPHPVEWLSGFPAGSVQDVAALPGARCRASVCVSFSRLVGQESSE